MENICICLKCVINYAYENVIKWAGKHLRISIFSTRVSLCVFCLVKQTRPPIITKSMPPSYDRSDNF